MALVQFIFSGFWHFVGSLLLVLGVLDSIANIVRAARRARVAPAVTVHAADRSASELFEAVKSEAERRARSQSGVIEGREVKR